MCGSECTCSVYARFMLGLCSVYARFMLGLCSVYARFMLGLCSGLCSVYARFMLGLCSVYEYFNSVQYSPQVYRTVHLFICSCISHVTHTYGTYNINIVR